MFVKMKQSLLQSSKDEKLKKGAATKCTLHSIAHNKDDDDDDGYTEFNGMSGNIFNVNKVYLAHQGQI